MAARKKVARRRRKPGRPTAYNATIAAVIVQHVRNGCTKDDAARAAGVGLTTFYRWQGRYRKFGEALTRARDELKAELIGVIAEGSRKDPRVAIAWIERLFPEEYAKTRILRHEGNPDKPVDLRLKADEELVEVARKLAGMTSDELRALRRPSSA